MPTASLPYPCPICSGPGQRQAEHPDAILYRCSACTHCYTDPNSVAAPETYGAEYFAEAHRNWFENPNTALFARVREEARAMGDGLSLLDVGCGKGDLLKYLSAQEPGWDLTGVDLSPNTPQARITFIHGDIFDLPVGKAYDIVTNLLVIEHIADIHRFVDALKAFCRPGGRLIITTNDENSVLYGVARGLQRCGLRAAYERLYSRHHLNHFSVATLRRLLELHGLTVVRTIHHNIPVAAVDLPPAGPLTHALWHAGVRGAFLLGICLRRTFLQTVVCSVPQIGERIPIS